VVVDVGETVTLPVVPETPVRLLTPLLMETEVAPVATQLSTAEPPDDMLLVER
jgi:hypothetical protein